MAQLSRPYQIALGAVLLFALVWFVALNGHGSSSGSTPTAGSTPAASSTPAAISTAVTKHGAAGASTTVVTKHGAAGASATVTTKHVAAPAPHKTATSGIPPRQAAIESELKRGEVAVVLFWNPKGADDNVVHEELQILLTAHHEIHSLGHEQEVHKLLKIVGLELEKKIAVHYASASQVASFGTFTKTVQVYGTPTILVINKRGAVTTINGLTDAFAIEQTIDEARQES